MVLIPGMARIGERLKLKLVARQGVVNVPVKQTTFDDLEGHVIIAGFGRVGRVLADILVQESANVVALERSAVAATRAYDDGWQVYLGDASRAEILSKAGAQGAALFVVTVDDPKSAENMVRAMRKYRPEAPIYARARDADHADSLLAAGADFVIPDAIEASLQLAGRALEQFGYDGESVRDRLANRRDIEYRRVVVEPAHKSDSD